MEAAQQLQVRQRQRTYLLYHDADIDFTWLGGGSRSPRFGSDFSRNTAECAGDPWRMGAYARLLVDAGEHSEFGEKQNARRLELMARFYFPSAVSPAPTFAAAKSGGQPRWRYAWSDWHHGKLKPA